MVRYGLLNRLQRRLQVGTRRQRGIAVSFQRLEGIAEIEWACDVELFDRCTVIEHLQQLDFGGSQVDDRRFDFDSYCTRSS